MSQNKTVIQGLEPNDSPGRFNNQHSHNLYSRGTNSPAKGTVVPGMMNSQNTQSASRDEEYAQHTSASPKRQAHPGKPVVGFLYSVSRTPLGEYWPLVMGKNTIGQSADNDIVLGEGTVSSNHAIIVTRQVKSGLIAAISDTQSTNGTKINGEMIGFVAEPCNDGDIITIGNNYEFLLTLIDTASKGLSVSQDFIPVDVNVDDDDDDDDIPAFDPHNTRHGFGTNNVNGSQWIPMGNQGTAGTVGLDGSTSSNNRGGTVSM